MISTTMSDILDKHTSRGFSFSFSLCIVSSASLGIFLHIISCVMYTGCRHSSPAKQLDHDGRKYLDTAVETKANVFALSIGGLFT